MPSSNQSHVDAGGLIWFTIHFPLTLDLATLTNLIRPLAHRPQLGLLGRTPLVVIELRAYAGQPYWLLGMDLNLSTSLPDQLRAQVPRLVLTATSTPQRPTPFLVSDLRITGLSQPLRLDMAPSVSAGLHDVLRSLGNDESAVLQWVIGPAQRRHTEPPQALSLAHLLGLRGTPPTRSDQLQHWRRKTVEPLFAVHGRVGARTARLERTAAVVQMLAQAVSLASASYTEIRSSLASRRGGRTITSVPRSQRWSGILNAAELASLLGYPFDELSDQPPQAHPAPPSLLIPADQPHHTAAVRVLGRSLHPADEHQLVTMPVATALHHVHVTGVTGSGKSTQLASFVRADMRAGHGVLLIEPRGDLVDDVLKAVPATRRDDVVVIEPGLSGHVVGVNPLAGSPEEAERRADLVMHLFRQVFGSSIGPRSADVLLHALTALARSRDGSLADLPVLLTNATFRRQVLTEVTDPLVLAPFFAWYDNLSDAERAQAIAPVLNKTRAFLSRSALRHLLGQAAPRFTLDDLFTQRRIVLVNLNAGVLGAETASMTGALLLTQLWQAIQRRATVPLAERHPVMVVIDEIQDYLKLPVDIGELLAQARALGVSLTAAHQHLGQLSPTLKAAFFANARSRMAFHPSTDDTRDLAQVFGDGTTATDLERLGRFQAYCRLVLGNTMTKPFIVQSRPLGAASSNSAELRLASQQRYGVSGNELDAQLVSRWRGGTTRPDGPIGIGPRSAA
ncbi:type IV secretory system conjugative DNA transfer family protein [Saccharothrix sp. HUAS TT1]|uniref:type IV secretory system conjugative DNA transfer family protein n=1 Tax=unclassified Saccharothrix TaxID=2593673 RepID=UPI00345B7D05